MELQERQKEESLLDWMARLVTCEYLSDLRRLTDQQRQTLTEALTIQTADEKERRQWNDTLTYLFEDSAPQDSAAAARALLLRRLSSQRQQ